MPDSDHAPRLHPANEVISKLYSAVVDNKNIPELFSAWDHFIDDVFKNDPEKARLWQTLLSDHFQQAGPLVVATKPSMAEEKQAFVDRQSFPSILFNLSFRLITKNQEATDIWPAEFDHDISTAALPPFDAQRVLSLHNSHSDYPTPVLVSLDVSKDGQSHTVMAMIHPVLFINSDGRAQERLFVLRMAIPRWHQDIGRLLADTYHLTEAELEVARGLYQNQSLTHIAQARGRSVRTVRTQLSHIFEKTDASTQSELISMMSNLGQLLTVEHQETLAQVTRKPAPSSRSDSDVCVCYSHEGHALSYVSYGAKNGRPVFSIQPTTPPDMTERFRQAATDSGLRFISPYKPGSGQSSSRNYRYTPKIAAQDFKLILDAEGLDQVDVVGVNSGGVYALQFANDFPAKIDKLILADTGVPLKPPGDFMKMSAAARRTFLPARYFSKILLTPHKIVAKDFHESQAGQKRVVDYFFSGSPCDLERVQQDDHYYAITREIIRYSFEDIKQLVDDVCLWASDWQHELNAALNKHSLTFLHGRDNDVFMFEAVERFAQGHDQVEVIAIEGTGQLGLFVHPQSLMSILK